MYNVRALRCKVNMENLINLLWRRSLLVRLVACVWNDHCLLTHLQFCMFKAIHSSRPSSLLSVLLEACPPNLWPEVIYSVTQLFLVMHFFFFLAL